MASDQAPKVLETTFQHRQHQEPTRSPPKLRRITLQQVNKRNRVGSHLSPKETILQCQTSVSGVHGVPFAWTALSHLSLVKIPPH